MEPQSFEVLRHWLDTIIEEAQEKLNDWEFRFIEDMSVKIANKWALTQKQQDTLENLYARYTS